MRITHAYELAIQIQTRHTNKPAGQLREDNLRTINVEESAAIAVFDYVVIVNGGIGAEQSGGSKGRRKQNDINSRLMRV